MENKIVQFFQERVKRYGAPYYTFAIFGLINHPTAYILEYYANVLSEDSLWIRAVAIVLCLLLAVKDHWPKKLKRFLPVYWYVTVTFCIPVLITFLLLKNNTSLWWLMNYGIGILILVLVLDWLMSLYSLLVGIATGLVLFLSIYHQDFSWKFDSETTAIALYMYVVVYVIAAIFVRNKEVYKEKLSSEFWRQIRRENKYEKMQNSRVFE